MIHIFTKRFFVQASTVLTLALMVSVAACSKKKKDDGGDTAGDAAAMQATDLAGGGAGSGAKIPELGTVYFEFDSFSLTAKSKTALKAHAEWLKSNSARLVQVEGHCDERGTTEYNLALGERRAAAVKDYLVSQGVSAGQLSTISFGEERPAVAGNDESAWSQNRRAEFISQ